MSFPKNDRKIRSSSGKIFPKSTKVEGGSMAYGFATGIAAALHRAYGNSHGGVKTVVALTGANERAVRNWFEGKNGPSGEHLIGLIRHSDPILEAFPVLAGRERVLTAKLVVDAKDKLIEILERIRELEDDDTAIEG